MPTPKTHYRIALGENNGQHSWIIHSSKGITWHNIPDELVTLLKKLTVNELLDFSLGSDGRWFVRYRQKGPEKQELSPYLWMDLNQGSNVKLDRLTLGPDTDHWGVLKAADGSFQRFRSVGNRDRFTTLLDSKTDQINSNNQIGFVSLGFRGDWAFSVNGYVQHRCGKPFHTELSNGWKTKKRVSTIVLSSMARVWIIVWEDGTLSHNLPVNIANEVEDYCQLQHSLKNNRGQPNPRRPKAQKPKPPRNNPQSTSTTSPQTQQQTPKPTNPAKSRPTPNSSANTTQLPATQTMPITNYSSTVTSLPTTQTLPPPTTLPSFATLIANATQATGTQINTTSVLNQNPSIKPAPTRLPTFSQVPNPPLSLKPLQSTTIHSTTQPVPALKIDTKPVQRDRLVTRTASQVDGPVSRAEMSPAQARVYVRPKKLTTTLALLNPDYWKDQEEYYKILHLFNCGWKHPNKKCPRVKKIFSVQLPDHLNESYEAYKALLEGKHGQDGINEKLLFHGTQRCCSFDIEGYANLCEATACSLCLILRTSFLVSKSGSSGRSFKRFGSGTYTSSVSSKADDYANKLWLSENKVVLVAKVALGKGSVYYRTTQDLTEPPYGYDSVLGEVGGDLNYDEQVLYKDEAIRPAYVVVYEEPIRVSQTTTTRPRPVQTQTYTTTTTTTTNSSSSSGCTIM